MRDILPTMPPALPELRHDLTRIEWEERGRAHYAACQIEAALELIDALRKGGVQ